ncbi:MAG: hypothetical protein IJJ26_08595 [Victivallales bacterium]|nr:hypothetical protein [Victivallales bacterium]
MAFPHKRLPPLPVEDTPLDSGLTPDEFDRLVLYDSSSQGGDAVIRRARLMGFGDDVKIGPGVVIRIGTNTIGEHSFISMCSYINGDVRIGKNVLIGPHCSITASNHKFDPATQAFTARDEKKTVVIGDGSWLGSNVVVTSNASIGKANLICAGAVVTHDTPDYAIMAGCPARQIGRIDPVTGEYIWFSHQHE